MDPAVLVFALAWSALVRFRFRNGIVVVGTADRTGWFRHVAYVAYSYEWQGRKRRGVERHVSDEPPAGGFGLPIELVVSPAGTHVLRIYRD